MRNVLLGRVIDGSPGIVGSVVGENGNKRNVSVFLAIGILLLIIFVVVFAIKGKRRRRRKSHLRKV